MTTASDDSVCRPDAWDNTCAETMDDVRDVFGTPIRFGVLYVEHGDGSELTVLTRKECSDGRDRWDWCVALDGAKSGFGKLAPTDGLLEPHECRTLVPVTGLVFPCADGHHTTVQFGDLVTYYPHRVYGKPDGEYDRLGVGRAVGVHATGEATDRIMVDPLWPTAPVRAYPLGEVVKVKGIIGL